MMLCLDSKNGGAYRVGLQRASRITSGGTRTGDFLIKIEQWYASPAEIFDTAFVYCLPIFADFRFWLMRRDENRQKTNEIRRVRIFETPLLN
jgi:hypothetical protein